MVWKYRFNKERYVPGRQIFWQKESFDLQNSQKITQSDLQKDKVDLQITIWIANFNPETIFLQEE